MMSLGNNNMTLSEFERLLDVYGSDRTRWPVDARANAGQLAARDPAARRLLVEAEALDRVLERAPLPSLAAEAALAERIVAAAQRSPRIVRTGDAAIGAREAAGGVSGGWRSDQRVIRLFDAGRRLRRSPAGSAAGLLAACLALGVFVGSALPQQVLPAFEDITGISIRSSGYTTAALDPFDEDLL